MGVNNHNIKKTYKKRKKKGRPPLKKQNFPNPNRRSARRNPKPPSLSDDEALAFAVAFAEDDDDELDWHRRRRAKKMRHVLKLPSNQGHNGGRVGSEDGDNAEVERQNSASKATDAPQEPSDSGPTTPLPDKKLLVFILDRLQKKDTFDVFSEPVDPEELPDYHDVIKHPMDFGTIRQKLLDGVYANLEEFEKDVYLISSNAMQYNAPDTIYFRQARAIQEKAKKDFNNLRHESDDNENDPKPARRGRPPMKNVLKKLAKTDHTGSDFSSNAILDVAGDKSLSNFTHGLAKNGSDKCSFSEVGARPSGVHNIEPLSSTLEHKQHEEYPGSAVKGISTRHWKAPSFTAECRQERHEEYSGSATKGFSMRHMKKFSVRDDNRRRTYRHPEFSSATYEQSILTAMDGERKQLLPVGLHMEHAYARSLARFASNLGPAGWEIAAKLLERVVPPGTKFGRGWVGENDVPQQSRLPVNISTSFSSKPEPLLCTAGTSADEQSGNLTAEEVRACTDLSVAASLSPDRPAHSVYGTENVQIYDNGTKPQFEVGSTEHIMWPKAPFQLHQNHMMQPTSNGFTDQISINQPSLSGRTVMTTMPAESFSTEAMMTHSRALDMVSRNNIFIGHPVRGHLNMGQVNSETDPKLPSNSGGQLHDANHSSLGPWQSLSLNLKQGTVPPDLSAGFQSPGSGVVVESQHPDLALQL